MAFYVEYINLDNAPLSFCYIYFIYFFKIRSTILKYNFVNDFLNNTTNEIQIDVFIVANLDLLLK